jgi:hypothetical protein
VKLKAPEAGKGYAEHSRRQRQAFHDRIELARYETGLTCCRKRPIDLCASARNGEAFNHHPFSFLNDSARYKCENTVDNANGAVEGHGLR